MITVFFDGKCGLCSKEIQHYQRIAPMGVFDWQDITQTTDLLQQHGISIESALKLLHAVDQHGNVHIGVDAFILIWKQLRAWKLMAFIVDLPIIRQLANFTYRRFAEWRFKRLPHCKAL